VPGLIFEPGSWGAWRSTTHGARERWPLSYMGRR